LVGESAVLVWMAAQRAHLEISSGCQADLRQFEPENGERNADFLMLSWVRIHAPAKCSVTKSWP
jgi:hypothetical protein